MVLSVKSVLAVVLMVGCNSSSIDRITAADPPSVSPTSAARDSTIAGIDRYMTALESYFADNNTYPPSQADLRWYHERPDPRVSITLETFGAEGYALIGRDTDWPGSSCVLLTTVSDQGGRIRTDGQGLPAIADGRDPICDSL
jgi:hypothetical protein